MAADKTSFASERVAKMESYSTTETRVGTWIDGKPIYQLVIEDTTPTVTTDGTEVIKSFSIPNVSKIIEMEGIYLASAGNYYHVMNGRDTNTNHRGVQVAYNVTEGEFRIYCNVSYASNTPFYAIIRYTKTTD